MGTKSSKSSQTKSVPKKESDSSHLKEWQTSSLDTERDSIRTEQESQQNNTIPIQNYDSTSPNSTRYVLISTENIQDSFYFDFSDTESTQTTIEQFEDILATHLNLKQKKISIIIISSFYNQIKYWRPLSYYRDCGAFLLQISHQR